MGIRLKYRKCQAPGVGLPGFVSRRAPLHAAFPQVPGTMGLCSTLVHEAPRALVG